ncbi:MAG: DUF262 domain-containing protein [Chloroflexota bacterium]|nr:DUF262 domain-containing protein [Chloroflexota bacterium]
MSKVQAQTKSVRELLSGVKYGIDFYQREYVWARRNIEELLNDFEGRFLASYDESHERITVSKYPHYFLGSIITIAESGMRYIVDGQQRLTTLTLLLIHLQHQLDDSDDVMLVRSLVFSPKRGVKDFNLDIPERRDCMDALFRGKGVGAIDGNDASVNSLIERYGDIEELFPETLKGEVLPLFVDWLIENVNLVEIEAQTDDDAFTIFETMNDRGVNLSQTDMLKGYLLANINEDDVHAMHNKKAQAEGAWRRLTGNLNQLWPGEDEVFLKLWLRAKYAETIRERRKGATNRDFENIDKFHRWARDNRKRLGLRRSDDYYEFITLRFSYFARHYVTMHQASWNFTPGREELYHNMYISFSLQYLLALAPLRVEDDDESAHEKIRLVTTFADIFLARRMANFRRNGYSTLVYRMFVLAKRIRDKDVVALRDCLLDELAKMGDTFAGITGEGQWGQPYALNNFTGRSIKYLLARMTTWVEQQCGMTTTFETYARPQGKPFEIEHIWADSFDKHIDEFSHEIDFQRQRNFFGGLVLLPRGDNQSYKDMPYEEKFEHYPKQNLLTASLHPLTYKNNPNFTNFVKRSGLPFKPHPQFKRADLMQRQELYRQICEQIWSPDRLDAI